MACGSFAALALTAVILGSPQLKIERQSVSPASTYCAPSEPTDANAVVSLKDAAGHVVLERKIRVPVFDFYDTPKLHGGYPSKSVTILFNYGETTKTAKAETVEVKMLDRDFKQTASLSRAVVRLK